MVPFRLIRGAFTRRVGKTLLWSILLSLAGEGLRYFLQAHLLGDTLAAPPNYSLALLAGLAFAILWLLAKSFVRALTGLAVAGLLCLALLNFVWVRRREG